MGLTKRFVILLTFGVIPLMIGMFINNSLSIFVLYNLICVVLLIVDYKNAADEGDIVIEELSGNKFSLYENETISFRIYNNNDYTLKLEVKDEIPEFHFTVDNKVMSGVIPPHDKKILEYKIIPTKRGAFMFEAVYIRYTGKLNLCTKIRRFELRREYKIYPNLKNLRKYRLSICNNRLFRQGQRNMKAIGRGTSFESLRDYVHGDEYRKINWQATARKNKPIVNEYQPEKNQHIHIMIDTGRPMSYTIRGYNKLDLAINTAIVLTDVINQNGDKAGAMTFNTEVLNMIMPGNSSAHRNKLLDMLYHIENTNLTSNYYEAFCHLMKKERHRSIVFIFTDFETVEEAEYMIATLPVISKNNIVIIMLIRNESLEKIGSIRINNSEEIFKKGVALELLDERNKIKQLLNRKGILCVECEAEELEYTAVNKYIQVKNRFYI